MRIVRLVGALDHCLAFEFTIEFGLSWGLALLRIVVLLKNELAILNEAVEAVGRNNAALLNLEGEH